MQVFRLLEWPHLNLHYLDDPITDVHIASLSVPHCDILDITRLSLHVTYVTPYP